MSKEIWNPIPGYETYYEASTLGRIRSFRKTGPRQLPRNTPRLKKARLLNRVVRIQLSKDGVNAECSVGEILLKTFVGPKPKGKECAHRDCNPQFGVEQTTISNIKVGKSWSWLTRIPKRKR